MIKINLAKMKQAKLDAGMGSSGSSFSSFSSGASILPMIRKLIVPLALSGVIYFGYQQYIEQRMLELQEDISSIEQERVRLQAEAGKLKNFERQREEFEKTELMFRKKVETIQKLLVQRNFAAQSLIALSKSLTPDLWLTSIAVNESLIRIKGSTVVDSQISDFMSSLDSMEYFKDVSLRGSSMAPGASKSDFELEARRQ